MQSDLSISLNSIFSEREEGFLHSLQQALSAATTDKYIRQMFDDKLSANYVPDRICELIKFFLNDERELFVEELLRRLKALEACLGSERIKQLEEIGQRLMEVSQTQAQKEAEYRKCVQILNDQIGNFQENIGDELKIMKTNVSSLSNSTKSIFNTLQKFKLSLSSDFQDFKKQSRKLVKNLSNINEKVNDQMKKIKSDNSNLMRQVNQLKEALDELRISKDNALRAQAEQFYSDISKLKEDFNNQRMEDLELNKQTENQMNQMRETLRNKFADKIQKIQQEAENAIKEMNVAHDNDVTALQKKVNRLNAKNNMLKDELSQSLNSINSLKNGQDVQIRKLQNKILKLSEQNEKNEADLSRKQEKIKKTQQENDKLNNEIQIINQKLLENDRMLQDAAKNLMQKQNEVDHNVFEKSKLIASKNEISQSLSNMNDELRNKDKELSQIQDKLDEVNKEKQSVIKEKEDIQSELNNLIKKAKKKDETIDQLSEKVKEIPKLQDEIDDLKGKNGKLEETKNENSENRQTIEKLQNQNKKLQASVNKLQNQIKDKDFELESKQNAIDSFEKENNEQTDLNTKLQTSLMQTKDQIRQKDKELNMLKQAIEEQQSMTQRQLFDLESMQAQVSQIPTLQNEKQDAIMKANLLERQNHELKSKINELQITIQQVRQQLHQIKAIAQAGPSKEELSRQIQSLLKENSTLKVKNKNLLGQLQSCQDELSSTKHHFDTTTSQFREKTRKLNELQNKLNSSQEIVNDSKLKIEDLTEKCSEYESSLKILAKKYQKKDKLIGSQKKSQNELRRKLQASEENNQKLSSSLSNVNNELLSLREELRNKNNENVQLKESLENNSMTARELTSTQRSLNDKISLLNNCEERNAALLRDIEKKEAKIGQLSDTLMEKDKEIQNLKQAQYTQKKQNETLTALTQDQQRQLDEGHRNLMKMQEEILRVQNEALSKGDSIKAIEVDHNREAEGRKQIQALINEDREKYRERITKLQDDNSSLLVEKAELEHKINQIKFENQTLSQLLESKESELSFEKERGNQDLLSTREMTSKIMVENKQLRQKLNDKEQYDKQLLAQIQEYIKSLINLDDIPELSRKMMETQEELQEICDTLNVKDPSEIPGEIDRIRDLNKALKANENKLHSLFPDNNADDIFNLISNLKKENSELQEMKSQLQQLTKSSNIIKSVQSLLLTIKAFDKRETELIRMIPNYEFENLTKDIAKLLKDNQKQNNLLEEIKIESGSSSIDSIPSIISEAINKLNFYTNIEKNLKQLIPISSMSEASDYIEKILKSNDELGLELSKANACIPSEYEGDLSSKISNLAKDNLENKSTIKSIIKGLPEHLQMTNDLSGTVSKIAHENEELKRQHKDILNTHLNNALQKNRELLKERNQIALNLNCTESDDLPEKTLEVIEEKNKFLQMVEEIEGILPKSSKGTDIFSRLKFLLKELENSQKVLKAIRHSIDSDDDHLINNVNNLVKKFADSENLLNEIESYFPPSHEILSDRVKYLIDNSNEMNEQLQALKNLFPKSNKDLQNDVANLLKEHNHVNQTIKQLNEIINGENNHDNIIEKAKEMKEKIEKGDQLLTKVKDILNDPTLENDNVPPSLQALVKHIQKLENKMKEIDGLLPKSKGQEDVVTKLKREKKRKEDLKKLLDNIINLLPHCSTEQEIERSLSEILEFLKSLYHLIYIQNIDKMKRVIKTDIKTQEADLLSIQFIEYEQIIDDLQHIFEEFQHNIVILSDFDQILPRNKDTNIINRLNKELQKKKQQEDLLNEIQKALSQRNHHTTDILSCLQEELALSNDLQDIVETLHSILPQNHDDRNRFEDDFDAEKREFNRSIIPKVQQEIDMKNSFQKKILEIENLLPKSKDDNLSNRLKKELDKKEQLQKQLDDLSSRFDHCKTFDDLSSHISELLRNNSNLKNILYQIDGLFSEVQNKVINDYDEEDEKEKDDFSYLIQIIGQYIDNTNSLKRKLEEIESLLPKYKNQGDLVSRLKDEFNKKEKVQQLAGKLQNIIPGVKTPEELAKKVQKILQEKEIQKTIIEQLNDILPELSENRTSNYDEEEDDNQMIEIGHNLPKRSQDIMNKYNQMKTLLDAINNLLPQNNKNDLITKLKKELKNKDRVQQQMEKLNNLLDSTSGNGADLSSKLKDLIQENEEMKQQLDELDSTLPQTNEDDDLLTRIKKLIKSKENQDSLVTEIESTLPKSNNQLGIVSRIKNELKQKEKLQQQLDSLKSILNTPNNSDIINQYKEMAQDNSDMRRILDEANGLLSSHDEDIIPKIEKLLKQKEEQAQTIEDIEGILPKSKTKDSIVKRIQKELQKKDELHKQLESMKSVLPGNKLSGDISDYLKQLLDENNLLKQLNEEINDILPSGDEEMLAKIQNMTQENENLKKQVSEIDSLVPGSPSRENIVDKLKKEFKKNQKTQQNLNSLMSLLPEVSTPEELYVALQNIMTDNNIMKRDLENIGSIFAEGDEDLHSKVQSLMKENDGLNHLVNEIDSLVPKQKGKQGIIDRLKSEFKSKEKLQKKLEEMNDLMNSSKTSLNDPMSSLQSLLEENSNQRELLETISSILPTKEGIEENDIISQSQFAVDEISRLNGIIEDIERLLPTSKTNDNLISRLKKELEHKTKFEKGIENIQELLPTCKNINDLPTTISNLLELKELFKHYVSDIVSIVNQSNNNQRESEKEYETENEISDDYPENEGKEFLNELEKLMNEFEEMKTERRQIEELLPKINNKNKESLLTRLKQEFDKNKKNEEELQQLYSHFSNNDNISHILEEISQYRHEIEELTNMFESELSPQHNYSDYENDSVIELAKKVIDDKKENDKIISTLEKIIPMKDKKGDIVVNAKKLVDEYDNLMKHVNKIMKILPKSNSFDDITKSIQEIMDEKNELNNKMNQYQTIFPISNSLDDLENLHINENGVVEDIPTRLKRLIKEKKEVCELLGVPDDIKAAIDVLLDENKTLKKENGELYLIINQLKELFEVKSHSELVDAAIHQRETIESTSDLFVKLLEILAGPMNTSITLRLPISPQIKEKLWKILTEMKQKMNDTDEKIIHILTKAKRAGYEGIDPCDAVKFLEETATLYEQQRVNEFFHGQVSSIRELMNEQHKTYESTKNKYNRQAKEQKEMLLEMQEKFALREEEMMQECEDVNNQMIALKEELEKANKLKTEILRLACGQAADMEYLRSNMSRTENSLLKNAEKMRTIVAQVQARSANKKKSTKVQKKPQVEHLSVQPEKPTQ